ncbi:hypothetical protein TKK_0018466 [Trichogramma kaykai]|uniref:Diphthamide biosynthesis protein 3 n=1 Tax=Trichogramma kaykai TaxID=54128 RepID=A0ABD2VY56_9HYME
MTNYHDEVEIEDLEYDAEDDTYYYPCPCGDSFQITKAELLAGETDATCPSCSLVIKIIYDHDSFVAENGEGAVEKSEVTAKKIAL